MGYGPRLLPDFNTKKVRLKPSITGPSPRVHIYHFNTKKVRLKPAVCFVMLLETTVFQYQKGAIKTNFAAELFSAESDFNTKKVRLKQTGFIVHLLGLFYFNTKKVRLKRTASARRSFLRCRVFQYQKGAIKTQALQAAFAKIPRFQYQKGAIKTFDLLRIVPVRPRFQYQKGAIKTVGTSSGTHLTMLHFNTKKVRLKLAALLFDEFVLICISIPKRCD